MSMIRVAAAGLLLWTGLARADDMNVEYGRGLAAYQRGDCEEASRRMQTVVAAARVKAKDDFLGYGLSVLGACEHRRGAAEAALQSESEAAEFLRKVGDKRGQAYARREAAGALLRLRRYPEAQEALGEAIGLDRENEDDASLRADQRSLCDAQSAGGEQEGALACLRALAESFSVPGEAFQRGDVLNAASGVLGRLGRREEAARMAARAAELIDGARVGAAAKHSSEDCDRHFNSANQKASVGDVAGAVQEWRALLASARKVGFQNGVEIALLNLGTYDGNAGRYDEAKSELAEGARVAHEAGDGTNETTLLMTLGVVTGNSGDIKGGLATLYRARAVAAQRAGADAEVNILQAIHQLYGLRGDYRKMEAVETQMAESARRSGRKRLMLRVEQMLGESDESVGDSESAAGHYGKLLGLARDLGDRELIAEGLNETGIGAMNMGDFEKAETDMRDSLSIRDWPGGHVNMGEIYLHSGRFEAARRELEPVDRDHIDLGYYSLRKGDFARAEAIYAKNAVPRPGNDDVYGLVAAQTGLGLAREGQKDYAGAAEHFTAAEKRLDELRDSLAPARRTYFLSTDDWMMPHLEPFEGMVRVSAFLPGGAHESFRHAEYTRGRLFAEKTARRFAGGAPELPPERAADEARIESSVRSAAAAAEESFRAGRMAEYAALEKAADAERTAQEAFVAGLRKEYPVYAAARYPEPMYSEELALEPGEVLIEFEVTAPYTKVFVVKDGKVVLSFDVRLTREDLTALVKRYRSYFEDVGSAEQLAAYDPALGRRLYGLLLKPAFDAKDAAGRALVPADARITIVPDEILGILPFESLVVSAPAREQMPVGRHGPAPAGVRYVGDERDIAYEYSATAMTVSRRLVGRAPAADGLFVLADPVFNPSDPRSRGTAGASLEPAPGGARTLGAASRTMGLGGSRRGLKGRKTVGRDDFLFERLDQTGLLARDLRDKVFAGDRVDELLGLEASKEGLSKVDLSRYRYLVFATHGVLDGAVPGLKEPALVLDQMGPGARDGFLRMSEVMGMRLGADLVALTACQTGLGRRLTGEGVLGMGRAFQYAGAKSVLVSLWNVAEDSTTLFAERFFAHLKEGKSKRQALRLARADMRRAGYEHPFYWSPFILVGG